MRNLKLRSKFTRQNTLYNKKILNYRSLKMKLLQNGAI